MDDFNSSVLSDAKSEYSTRLVTILTPLIIEGIKSIFKEAYDLCNKNDEKNKYLMTFQNFLTRIPRWNQQIINEETKRIVLRSNCSYLEDILTCVHITQLKILTSIRVSSKQKKVNIDIPKLPDFIHKVYIVAARKVYENVYLFEANIAPLQQQKNMRECEIICQESILNVVRDSMPIESILRAYIDETEEEEIVHEIANKPLPMQKKGVIVSDPPKDSQHDISSSIVSTAPVAPVKKMAAAASAEAVNEKPPAGDGPVGTVAAKLPVIAEVSKPDEPDTEKSVPNKISLVIDTEPTDGAASSKTLDKAVLPAEVPAVPSKPPTPPNENESPKKSKLSFNNDDTVMPYKATDTVTQIKPQDSQKRSAPKTLERLEALSKLRHDQRKSEENEDDEDEDEETLTIHKDSPTVKLDALDIQVLDDNLTLAKPPLLTGVETI